jgi:hypothetical protein
MKFANCQGPFRAVVIVALVLLAPQGPALPVHGEIAAHAVAATPLQPAQQAAPATDSKTPASPAAGATPPPSGATLDHGGPPPRSLTAKAIDKVKDVAKSAGDIFSRVPCLSPKGGFKSMGSLPHVAKKLAAGQPVVIIAFGSSSTQGYGSSGPEFTYPNRLATQLRRQYPGADITVINSGRGGEDAPEMMKRLQSSVIDAHPDLVIWQVGTNAVLRNLDPSETANLVEDGVSRIQAAGADLVLVDLQYSPRVTEHPKARARWSGCSAGSPSFVTSAFSRVSRSCATGTSGRRCRSTAS